MGDLKKGALIPLVIGVIVVVIVIVIITNSYADLHYYEVCEKFFVYNLIKM